VADCLLLSAHRMVIFAIAQLSCFQYNLDFNETRDYGVTGASARSYANHLHLALEK